jgi:hypothetical protein
VATTTLDRGGSKAARIRKALDALTDYFPTLLASEGYHPDTCVLATRVACLALTEAGIAASPLACRLDVFNAPYVAALDDGWNGEEPMDPELEREILASGAWAITIGDDRIEGKPRPDGSRGFNAHLCVHVQRRWLLDLTLHQTNRPAKGIVLEPHYFDVDDEFVRGGKPVIGTANGCWLRYWVVHRNDYLSAPDWLKVRRDDHLVRASVTKIREALAQ